MARTANKIGPLKEIFLGMVFLAAGLGVVYLLGSDSTLVCHRTENTCTIIEDNLLKKPQTAAAREMPITVQVHPRKHPG